MITMMTTLLISTQPYKCSRKIPKMMYSPHFKDKLLPIKKNLKKIINDKSIQHLTKNEEILMYDKKPLTTMIKSTG